MESDDRHGAQDMIDLNVGDGLEEVDACDPDLLDILDALRDAIESEDVT